MDPFVVDVLFLDRLVHMLSTTRPVLALKVFVKESLHILIGTGLYLLKYLILDELPCLLAVLL